MYVPIKQLTLRVFFSTEIKLCHNNKCKGPLCSLCCVFCRAAIGFIYCIVNSNSAVNIKWVLNGG